MFSSSSSLNTPEIICVCWSENEMWSGAMLVLHYLRTVESEQHKSDLKPVEQLLYFRVDTCTNTGDAKSLSLKLKMMIFQTSCGLNFIINWRFIYIFHQISIYLGSCIPLFDASLLICARSCCLLDDLTHNTPGCTQDGTDRCTTWKYKPTQSWLSQAWRLKKMERKCSLVSSNLKR